MSTAVTGKTPDLKDHRRPEAVTLAIATWATALVTELIHQVTQTAMALLDPADLLAAARESAEQSETAVSDALVDLTAYGSIALMGLINLLILAGLTVALWCYATRRKIADGARRLLMVFSLYFALRGLVVFTAAPTGTDVPVWLMLIDGCLQLIVAVAAVLGLVFSGRKEAIDHLNASAQKPEK